MDITDITDDIPKLSDPAAIAQQQNPNKAGITTPMDTVHIERKCENPDCSAPTLISLVPTRRSAQFIHDPTVVPEPILVNGYTTVFEVGGITAKINELTTYCGKDGKIRYKSPKAIYRIVPNTHAHIVNYIIIDTEGEALRRIKQNDPVTIKKLLDSQKNSAEQLLEQLIGVRKDDNRVRKAQAPVSISAAASASTSTLAPSPASAQKSSTRVSNTIGVNTSQSVAVPQIAQVGQSGPIVQITQPVQSIQSVQPVQSVQPIQPVQSVQSVQSVDPVQPLVTTIRTGVKITPTSTGVALNTTPISTSVIASTSSIVTPIVVNTPVAAPSVANIVNTSALEKLQNELRELQETVKLLKEEKRLSARGSGGHDSKRQRTT